MNFLRLPMFYKVVQIIGIISVVTGLVLVPISTDLNFIGDPYGEMPGNLILIGFIVGALSFLTEKIISKKGWIFIVLASVILIIVAIILLFAYGLLSNCIYDLGDKSMFCFTITPE